MGAHAERQWVAAMYPNSARWKHKVEKMTDAQVVAIYLRKKSEPDKPKESTDADTPF